MNLKIKSIIRNFLPRTVQKHRILAGPVRGAFIHTSWHDYPAAITGRTEMSLLKWFQNNVSQSETWLDVGAHYGYTAIALCQLVGDYGRVFAFEPMITTAGYLNQTKWTNGFDQLTIIPFGLGVAKGVEVSHFPVDRGMIDRNLSGSRLDTLFITSLDWLWPQICGRNLHIDGVKIDVQGMEYETLKGMSQVLAYNKPKLVIEFHAGVERSAVLGILLDLGYGLNAVPVSPLPDEIEPLYLDDRSYAFNST